MLTPQFLLDISDELVALPSAARLAELPEDSRAALRDLLLDIRAEAADRAQICWRRHKAPMAAYWKAVSVYAGHAARALRGRTG